MSSPSPPVYMRDPPPGVERFGDTTTQHAAMVIIGIVAFSIATTVYALRIWTRVRLVKIMPRVDDYLAGVALLLGWTFFITKMFMAFTGGGGKQFWQVTTSEYEVLLKWTMACATTYTLSSVFAKLSLLCFYRGLSPEKSFRIVVNTLIGLISIYAITWTCLNIFGCKPLHAAWDVAAMATGECIDKGKFYLSASVTNVCMDGIVLLLPLRIVIPLQMPKRQKVTLLLLFATGGFVIIAAVQNIILTGKLFKGVNYTWDLATELCWCSAEISASVVCASAGLLKPFFVRYLPSLLSSRLHGFSNNVDDERTDMSKGDRSRTDRHKRTEQTDVYEMESGDESESKKATDDDEAKLWTGNGRHNQDIKISASPMTPGPIASPTPITDTYASRTRSMGSPYSRNQSPGGGHGINVTSELSISYSDKA
ncbi:hypothetical protein F4779DRAFT_638146 [Xylariaceae sp. FL0662B]|nr:hypothetical protein F4779DRAFT_638146 [Xylariaceae sp. FL0662B]